MLVAGPNPGHGVGANLGAVERLDPRHDCLVGWSDRQPGHVLALGAVARGACLITKAFTDDGARRDADHATVLDPPGFRAMVDAVRELERALRGERRGRIDGDVAAVRRGESRGVYAARALAAGTVLAAADLKIVRPALGAPPASLPALVGRRLLRACASNQPVDVDDVA